MSYIQSRSRRDFKHCRYEANTPSSSPHATDRIWTTDFEQLFAGSSRISATMAPGLHRRHDTAGTCRPDCSEILKDICWTRVSAIAHALGSVGTTGWPSLPRLSRTLDIKHLESDYGEILDLTDTVGEVFDDRAPSGENRTSIVRVACRPPISRERESSTRSISLMPESSARPRQRSLGYTGSSLMLNSQTPLPTTEGWNSQHSSITCDGQNKRRKIDSYKHLSGVPGSRHRERQDSSTHTRMQGHVQVRGSQTSPHREGVSNVSILNRRAKMTYQTWLTINMSYLPLNMSLCLLALIMTHLTRGLLEAQRP